MSFEKKLAITFVLLLSVGLTAWSQVLPTTPAVYASGGATVYTVTGSTFTPIFAKAGLNFESLAIGPDNAVLDVDANGNAQYAYFVYACDPAGTIIRIAFLPAATSATPPTVAGSETIYSGSVAGLAPVCGQSSSAGDFYITNKAGSGVFVFSGIANVRFNHGGPFPSPTPVTLPKLPKNMTGRGITQKYVGDLFVVDNFDNQVLRSPYAVPFSSQSTFINSNLSSPVGITTTLTTTLNPATGLFAANSNFFVANSNTSKKLPPVSVFTFDNATQTGVPAAACPALAFPKGNNTQVPFYLASAPTDQVPSAAPNTVITDTIYLITNTSNSGTLWTWNTSQAQGAAPNCELTSAASIGTPLSGVAVGPAQVTLDLSVSATAANPTPTNFNFNSSLFQLTATGCTASVTAYPLSVASVNSMIKLAQLAGPGDSNASPPYPNALIPLPLPNPATAAAAVGDGGFETAYVAHWSPAPSGPPCTSVFPDSGFVTAVYNFIDGNQFMNPRFVQCDNSQPMTEPQLFPTGVSTTCGSPALIGVYPLGGPISLDTGGRTNSVFLWVNEEAGAGNTTPGTFCGFEQPLMGDGTNLPNPPPSFTTSTTVNVKFKLSSTDCKNQKDFITNATALLSLARIADANGNPVFNAVNPFATASSIDVPPLFPPGNPQYSFTLNLPAIRAQAGAGTYSVTVTFLSDNTTNQITEFILQ